MAGVCWIVGAGAFTPRGLKPLKGDMLIAADGGYAALCGIGLRPDLLLGDFDSLSKPLPEDIVVLKYPVEKDDTDMGLALAEGYARGYRDFAIYGGGGGRLDHTLANIQLICGYSRRGCAARLTDVDCDIYAVTDGALTLPARAKGALVSVLCSGDSAEGVTLTGLKYPLNNATLTCTRPLGVSNEYAADGAAEVSVRRGTLYVVVALS